MICILADQMLVLLGDWQSQFWRRAPYPDGRKQLGNRRAALCTKQLASDLKRQYLGKQGRHCIADHSLEVSSSTVKPNVIWQSLESAEFYRR